MKQITATVISNHPFSYRRRQSGNQVLLGFQLLWLICPQMEKPEPGQFVMLRCGEECVLPRPFSIHQVNDDKIALWVAIWEDGKGTQWLANRKKGDTVEIVGPLGNGYSIYPEAHHLLLLAGGVGIAPLYFLAQQTAMRQCSVTLIHGASSELNLYPEKMPSGIKIFTASEDPKDKDSVDEIGRITEFISKYVDWADQIFACGPVAMYKAMATQKLLKAKSAQVSLEVRMGCGRGICYGCTVKTKDGLKQVCQDGPVFDLEDVLWDELGY